MGATKSQKKTVTKVIFAVSIAIISCVLIIILTRLQKISDVQAMAQQLRLATDDERSEFKRIATTLSKSALSWTDGKNIQYFDQGVRKIIPLKQSEVPAVLRDDILIFIKKFKIEAIFIQHDRVNFVLYSSGIAPSGTAAGVMYSLGDSRGCSAIVKSIQLNVEGKQCEKIDEDMYIFLIR